MPLSCDSARLLLIYQHNKTLFLPEGQTKHKTFPASSARLQKGIALECFMKEQGFIKGRNAVPTSLLADLYHSLIHSSLTPGILFAKYISSLETLGIRLYKVSKNNCIAHGVVLAA